MYKTIYEPYICEKLRIKALVISTWTERHNHINECITNRKSLFFLTLSLIFYFLLFTVASDRGHTTFVSNK